MGIRGMPEAAKGPAFSTAVGLLVYPQISQIEFTPPRFEEPAFLMTGTGGRLQRLGQWLRQSL